MRFTRAFARSGAHRIVAKPVRRFRRKDMSPSSIRPAFAWDVEEITEVEATGGDCGVTSALSSGEDERERACCIVSITIVDECGSTDRDMNEEVCSSGEGVLEEMVVGKEMCIHQDLLGPRLSIRRRGP